MDEFGSHWIHQENVEELKRKLVQVTYELQLERFRAYERSAKNLDDINKLIQLWKMALEERDEARSQLQAIVNNNNINYLYNSPLPQTANTTQTKHFVIKPAEVVSDVVSPKSNISTAGPSRSLPNPYTCTGSSIIDNLVKGKTLPKQGKLVDAILEAGPLLETIMVAGPLPKWRNPPPMSVPPVPNFEKFVVESGNRVGRPCSFANEPNGKRRCFNQ